MNSKKNLVMSIFQFVIGILAIVAFAVAGFSGENMTKWVVTLILAVAYVVLGVIGIADYNAGK